VGVLDAQGGQLSPDGGVTTCRGDPARRRFGCLELSREVGTTTKNQPHQHETGEGDQGFAQVKVDHRFRFSLPTLRLPLQLRRPRWVGLWVDIFWLVFCLLVKTQY
jgi:hypothetical protein